MNPTQVSLGLGTQLVHRPTTMPDPPARRHATCPLHVEVVLVVTVVGDSDVDGEIRLSQLGVFGASVVHSSTIGPSGSQLRDTPSISNLS